MAVYLVDFENVSSAGISGIQKLTKEDKVYIFYTANAANMSFTAHLNLLSSPAEVIYYNVSSGGKNALDFQLSSFLGYLICQGKEKNFCIISNDRGYEYVKTFWERSGLAADITISGSPNINRALLPLERPFTAKIQQDDKNEALAEAGSSAIAEAASAAAEEITEKEDTSPKKNGRAKGRKKASSVKQEKTFSADRTKIPQNLQNALAKAGVTDSSEAVSVFELLKSTDGKQQFYRGILKIFGMERGVEVYKAVRPEYTNLVQSIAQSVV